MNFRCMALLWTCALIQFLKYPSIPSVSLCFSVSLVSCLVVQGLFGQTSLLSSTYKIIIVLTMYQFTGRCCILSKSSIFVIFSDFLVEDALVHLVMQPSLG